jgi:hypothetical protein
MSRRGQRSQQHSPPAERVWNLMEHPNHEESVHKSLLSPRIDASRERQIVAILHVN